MESREHILNTSFKLFLQKNFKAVTMKEIVAESGLSKGAFYHYFDSKEKVFEEVLNYFFADFLKQDFDRFSHSSLKEFYEDYLKDMETKILSARVIGVAGEDKAFSANHYFLLFDGISMLPGFRERFLQSNKDELRSWKKIVKIARAQSEIRTELTDEQLAKMFIYISDGFGIHSIMNGELTDAHFRKELETLWHALYNQVRT